MLSVNKDGKEKIQTIWDKDRKNNSNCVSWQDDIHMPILLGLLTPLLESNRIRKTINALVKKETEILKLQKVIHKMQEWALMIYANCEATYEVRKSLYHHIDKSKTDTALEIMNSILSLVSSFNDGQLDQSLADLAQYGNRYTNVYNALAKSVADALRKTEKPQKPKNKTNKKTITQADESTEKVEDQNDDADV